MIRTALYTLLYTGILCLFTPQAYTQQKIQEVPVLQVHKTYTGRSVSVADGDTFTFLSSDQKQYHIRLDGIDAPEKGMPYYKVSKMYLAQLLKDKPVKILIKSTDQYNRYIARIYVTVNGRSVDIAKEMILAGLAWHYQQYNHEADLATAEQQARKEKAGLWKEAQPMAPWTVRKYRRAGISDAQFRQLQQEHSPLVAPYLQP